MIDDTDNEAILAAVHEAQLELAREIHYMRELIEATEANQARLEEAHARMEGLLDRMVTGRVSH